MKQIYMPALVALLLCMLLTGCAHAPPPDISTPTMASSAPDETTPAPEPTLEVSATPDETPLPAEPLVPEYEVELVAKTLRGECYDGQHDDKREVVRVICNRVSAAGRFGDSVEAVITAPRQFQGYRPGNAPTVNDYEIAREILTEWYAGGCQPLGKNLFFSAGNGHKNVFHEKY